MKRRVTILAAACVAAAALTAIAVAGSATDDHGMSMGNTSSATDNQLAAQIQASRLATAKYATNLARARKDGYGPITQMMPDMGWHFLNPKLTAFDVTRPAILVYGKHGGSWQLVAYEWVFPSVPAKPPLPGATYGSFGAACHYKDGTFVFEASEDACATKSPQSGAAFNFWHPNLVTLHLWAWYPNPSGVFSGTNPLMHPFNAG